MICLIVLLVLNKSNIPLVCFYLICNPIEVDIVKLDINLKYINSLYSSEI
ncbi:hypothetical protein FLAVO9AF_160079 [Flavobacterium sp. 9AF]|nr:hypothetical protein FLAVO9AF_160079 [Flavobacterium sp. 9AF]